MPLVNVMVNGRAYTIACDDGEEEHLKELAGHVDSKVRELLGSVGQVGDQRLLLMAAVLITDEFFGRPHAAGSPCEEAEELAGAHDEMAGKLGQAEASAVSVLEDTAKRIEAIAGKLAA